MLDELYRACSTDGTLALFGGSSEALFGLGLFGNITTTRENIGGDIVVPVDWRNDPIVWPEKRSVRSRILKQRKQSYFSQIFGKFVKGVIRRIIWSVELFSLSRKFCICRRRGRHKGSAPGDTRRSINASATQ